MKLQLVSGAVAVCLVFVLGLYVLCVWTLQRKLLFPAPRVAQHPAAASVGGSLSGLDGDLPLQEPAVESLWVSLGSDAQVEAWLLPPEGQAIAATWILFAHGNGELIDYWQRDFRPLQQAGIGIALIEYPGYGRSTGAPSQASITEVCSAVYDQLLMRKDVDPERMIGYGRSLGGGAVSQLASQRKLAALVLESTFSSVLPLARSMGVPGFLVRDPFDSESVLQDFKGPVLILHGLQDDLIPVAHAKRLRQAARDAEVHLSSCGHNDCPRPFVLVVDFLLRRSLVEPDVAKAARLALRD